MSKAKQLLSVFETPVPGFFEATAPYVKPGTLELLPVGWHSRDTMSRDYKKLQADPDDLTVDIQVKNGDTDNPTYVLGQWAEVEDPKGSKPVDKYGIYCMLQASKNITHTIPLSGTAVQLRNIRTAKGFTNLGYAKKLHRIVLEKNIAIVSDTTFYQQGKDLWISFSKNDSFNLFVWDASDGEGDWIRGSDKKPLRYQDGSIPDDRVWTSGSDRKGHDILIVAVPSKLVKQVK